MVSVIDLGTGKLVDIDDAVNSAQSILDVNEPESAGKIIDLDTGKLIEIGGHANQRTPKSVTQSRGGRRGASQQRRESSIEASDL